MLVPRRWTLRALMIIVALCALVLFMGRELRDRAPVYREIKMLRTGTPSARVQAAVQLGAMGPKAYFAEPALTAVLTDPDVNLREAAAAALFSIGSRSPALVQAFLRELETPPTRSRGFITTVRRGTDPVQLLIAMKPSPALLIPRLSKAARNADPEVRQRALEVLSDIAQRGGPPPPGLADALLPVLADRIPELRSKAATALAGMDSTVRAKAVGVLVEGLSDIKSYQVPMVLPLIGRFAPENDAAVAVLLSHLHGEDQDSRLLAILCLRRLEPLPTSILFELIDVMTEVDADRNVAPDFLQRVWTTELTEADMAYDDRPAYGDVPPFSLQRVWRKTGSTRQYMAYEAGEILNEMRRHGEVSLLSWSAATVHKMGPEAEEHAVRALIEELQDPDELHRGRVVTALGSLGSSALEAVPQLLEFLRTGNAGACMPMGEDRTLPDERSVRTLTTSALRKIGISGDPRIIAALARLLKDRDAATAHYAATALENLAPNAEAAIPVLVEALTSSNVSVRRWAAATLGKIGGPRVQSAVPALLTAVNDDDEGVAVHVGEALSCAGDGARAALPRLVRLLRSGNPDIRKGAADTLARFGPVARSAAPVLLAAMDDDVASVQDSAAKALAVVVPGTDPSFADAIQDLSASDPDQRFVAALALGQSVGSKWSPPVIQGLRTATRDQDILVREMAIIAIGHIGPDAASAAPELIEALRNGPAEVRQSAAYAVGRLVPGARDMLLTLIEQLKSEKRSTTPTTRSAQVPPTPVTRLP